MQLPVAVARLLDLVIEVAFQACEFVSVVVALSVDLVSPLVGLSVEEQPECFADDDVGIVSPDNF